MDELNLYSASSLTQQSTDRHVAPLVHMILLSQSVFHRAPYSCVRSGESTNTNVIVFKLDLTLNQRSTELEMSTLIITQTDTVNLVYVAETCLN